MLTLTYRRLARQNTSALLQRFQAQCQGLEQQLCWGLEGHQRLPTKLLG